MSLLFRLSGADRLRTCRANQWPAWTEATLLSWHSKFFFRLAFAAHPRLLRHFVLPSFVQVVDAGLRRSPGQRRLHGNHQTRRWTSSGSEGTALSEKALIFKLSFRRSIFSSCLCLGCILVSMCFWVVSRSFRETSWLCTRALRESYYFKLSTRIDSYKIDTEEKSKLAVSTRAGAVPFGYLTICC